MVCVVLGGGACSPGNRASTTTVRMSKSPAVSSELETGESKWAGDSDALSVFRTNRASGGVHGSEKVASDLRTENPDEFDRLDGRNPHDVAEAWASGYRFNRKPAFAGRLEGLIAYQRERGPVNFPVR